MNNMYLELEKDIVNDEQKKITIYTEDDRTLICNVVLIFNIKDEKYIAIVPEGEEKVYLYGFKEIDNAPILRKIEDEREFDIVSLEFNKILDSEEEKE